MLAERAPSNSEGSPRTSCSPTRTSRRRPRRRHTACSTMPARTAAPGRASSSRPRSANGSWSSSSPPSRASRSAILAIRRPRWGRSSRAGSGIGSRRSSPTTSRSRSGAPARRAPASGSRRPCSSPPSPIARTARRSSGRWSRSFASPTRLTPSAWRTTLTTACPARSGRGTSVARAVEGGNLSVNSHSSVRYWTPFGGFKQSGLGRELGPDALDAFTETKNVFINTSD